MLSRRLSGHASLDPNTARALSGGRVILGIGAGGDWDAITSMGVSRRTPAQAVAGMEETITLVRALCGGGQPVNLHGAVHHVTGLDPAPIPPPPIWTGAIGPKSLAVTGRLANGWIPGLGADWLSTRYRQSRPVIDDAAAAAGRDPAEIATIYHFGGPILDSASSSPRRDNEGIWLGGTVEQWVDQLTTAVLDHSASGFIYRGPTGTPSESELRRWIHEIVPSVQEAITYA